MFMNVNEAITLRFLPFKIIPTAHRGLNNVLDGKCLACCLELSWHTMMLSLLSLVLLLSQCHW